MGTHWRESKEKDARIATLEAELAEANRLLLAKADECTVLAMEKAAAEDELAPWQQMARQLDELRREGRLMKSVRNYPGNEWRGSWEVGFYLFLGDEILATDSKFASGPTPPTAAVATAYRQVKGGSEEQTGRQIAAYNL